MAAPPRSTPPPEAGPGAMRYPAVLHSCSPAGGWLWVSPRTFARRSTKASYRLACLIEIAVGFGDGRACSACDGPLLKARTQYEFELPGFGTFSFHLGCFGLYTAQLRGRGWLCGPPVTEDHEPCPPRSPRADGPSDRKASRSVTARSTKTPPVAPSAPTSAQRMRSALTNCARRAASHPSPRAESWAARCGSRPCGGPFEWASPVTNVCSHCFDETRC